MKKLLVIALALGSVTALAADRNSSWKEIYDAGLSAQWPQVAFNNEATGDLVLVSIDNVCVAGDQMQTIAPVEVCVERNSNVESDYCTKTDRVALSTARKFMKTIPGSEGTPDVTFEMEYPLHNEIAVGRNTNESFETLFSKDYTIESCR